jgi:hypothetical protein
MTSGNTRPAGLAAGLAALLGTVGWFVMSFGLGTTCTNKFSCGGSSCAPCAAMNRWVIAGGIGQWVLAAVAFVLLVLASRRISWQRNARRTSWFLIPLAVVWFIVSAVLAALSF